MEDEFHQHQEETERQRRARLDSNHVDIVESSMQAQEVEKKIAKDFEGTDEEMKVQETQQTVSFAEQLASQLGSFQLEKSNESTADMT